METLFSQDCPKKKSLDRVERQQISDKSFLRLEDGYTHYELQGNEENPLVVLVHGLTTSMFIWDYQMKALERAGYRVLRYDLYGRGLSDRPRTRYTASFYHHQLHDLLDTLQLGDPFALVGLSLGGAISVNFATLESHLTRSLFLVAPAGLRSRPWWSYFVELPGLLDVLEHCLGNWFWQNIGPKNLATDSEKRREAQEKMKRQLCFEGFHQALLSTLRHGPVYGFRSVYEQLGKLKLPVRALWSRTDRVVPHRLSLDLKELVPQAEIVTVREGTHTVNYDRPERVNPPLLDFLEKTIKNTSD